MRNPSRWALIVGLCCCYTTLARAEYSIPVDAIRIGAEELAAEQLTEHLATLLGNRTAKDGAGIHQAAAEQTSEDGHRLPNALLRLNALLRSAEERKEQLESSSAGRLLAVNRGGYFRGLLVVWLPVSFLLPTLARKPVDAYYRFRRSRSGSNDIQGSIYDRDSADYQFEINYGPLLSRLEGYFHLMRIDDVNCRWKLLCYASRQPDEYQPISDLFRRLFERSRSFRRPEQYHPALKKFFTYVWADKKGRRFSTTEECGREYAGCPTRVDRLIRTDMLLFWQQLSKRFAIQLQDE